MDLALPWGPPGLETNKNLPSYDELWLGKCSLILFGLPGLAWPLEVPRGLRLFKTYKVLKGLQGP